MRTQVCTYDVRNTLDNEEILGQGIIVYLNKKKGFSFMTKSHDLSLDHLNSAGELAARLQVFLTKFESDIREEFLRENPPVSCYDFF